MLESSIKIFQSFDFKANRRKIFLPAGLMRAIFTFNDCKLLAIKDFLDEILALCVRFNDHILNPVEENISELVNIHLHFHTGRPSFIIFKGLKEVSIYIGLALAKIQIKKYLLQLIDQILLNNVVLLPLRFIELPSKYFDVE